MSPPAWLPPMFAGVMLVIAAYCTGRLIAAGAWRRESELDADGVHLVMGVAMAGALAPRLGILPTGVWEMVFAVAAVWFAGQVIRVHRGYGAGHWRCPYPVPHLAESLAMVYMLVAVRAPAPGGGSARAAMPGMGGASGMARFPVVAVILALFMVGYLAWLADRLISISRPAAAAAKGEGTAERATAPVAAGVAAAATTRAAATSTCDRTADQYARAASGQPPAARAGRRWPVLAPRAAACYKIAMGVTMAYMLIIMV